MKYFKKEASVSIKSLGKINGKLRKALSRAKGVEIKVTKNGKKVKTFVSNKEIQKARKTKNKITGRKEVPIYK